MQINDRAHWLGYVFVSFSLSLLLGIFYLAELKLAMNIESVVVEVVAEIEEPTPEVNPFEDIQGKKRVFFEFLTPLVEAENKSIQKQRQILLGIYTEYQKTPNLSPQSQLRLSRLKQQFRLQDEKLETEALLNELLVRVDEIPVPMVLAQAAIESAWGTSRFALVANNYFGQWCFKEGCGVVPKSREAGSRHEVAKFKTARASVSSYFRNINTHNAYLQLRLKRASLQEQGLPVSSLVLIQELSRYSERGEEYIKELQQIISVNKLTKLEAHHDSV